MIIKKKKEISPLKCGSVDRGQQETWHNYTVCILAETRTKHHARTITTEGFNKLTGNQYI